MAHCVDFISELRSFTSNAISWICPSGMAFALVDSGEKNFMQNVRKDLKKLRSTQKEKSPSWVAGIKSCPAS